MPSRKVGCGHAAERKNHRENGLEGHGDKEEVRRRLSLGSSWAASVGPKD
jgi:hypothetical protein